MWQERCQYDIAVIGAGPSGLFAAVTAKRLYPDLRIVIFERLPRAGGKLPYTGGGRCNISHKGDPLELCTHYGVEAESNSTPGRDGRFLLTALYSCGHDGIADFFESQGLSLCEEGMGRYYPESQRAADVQAVLINYLLEHRVKLLLNTEVTAVQQHPDKYRLVLAEKQSLSAKRIIIAAGNPSFKAAGSNPDAFNLARQLGLEVSSLTPALCSVDGYFLRAATHRRLAGISSQVKVTLWRDNHPVVDKTGEILFTHRGFSGPVILDLSRLIRPRESLHSLSINWQIQSDFHKFYQQIKKYCPAVSRINSALKKLYPSIPRQIFDCILVYLNLSDVNIADLSSKDAQNLHNILRGHCRWPINTVALHQAMQACGGVKLTELDPRTMASRAIPGCYIIGDQLELAGDCGGYNLTMAWSTAFLAGMSAGESIRG